MRIIARFWKHKAGATAIEYCMIAGIVSLAVVAGATTIGHNLKAYFMVIANSN